MGTRKAAKSPAPSSRSTKRETATSVLLFYPNLIGYLRIACMLGSFWYAEDWKLFLALYLLAFGGDVVDGWFARRFNQSSGFGGVLDMVTDRVSTCGLLYFVGVHAAKLKGVFQGPLNNVLTSKVLYVSLIALDIFSHWFHVMSVSGHHKSSESLKHRNPLLQWYYSIYPLFGFACVGTELFYVYLYLAEFGGWGVKGALTLLASSVGLADTGVLSVVLLYGLGAACALKQAVNVVQLMSAGHALAEADAAARK